MKVHFVSILKLMGMGSSSHAQNNLNHLVIDNNEVTNLKLGLSEAIAVNGNLDSFEVTNNKVHDNNNIGIVLIGHEGVSPVAALDQARNGIVRNNIRSSQFIIQ